MDARAIRQSATNLREKCYGGLECFSNIRRKSFLIHLFFVQKELSLLLLLHDVIFEDGFFRYWQRHFSHKKLWIIDGIFWERIDTSPTLKWRNFEIWFPKVENTNQENVLRFLPSSVGSVDNDFSFTTPSNRWSVQLHHNGPFFGKWVRGFPINYFEKSFSCRHRFQERENLILVSELRRWDPRSSINLSSKNRFRLHLAEVCQELTQLIHWIDFPPPINCFNRVNFSDRYFPNSGALSLLQKKMSLFEWYKLTFGDVSSILRKLNCEEKKKIVTLRKKKTYSPFFNIAVTVGKTDFTLSEEVRENHRCICAKFFAVCYANAI